MAPSRKVSMIRGKMMRATRLSRTGAPVYGEDSVVTTKGFITASITTNVEEGEAVTATNAAGETCVSEPASPSFSGFTAEIEFCDVDFALFEMMTGQPVVLNDDDEVVGITESTDVDLSSVAFAMELWLGADTKGAASRDGSQGEWGYMLLPYLSGGVIGDVSVENAAITFTVNNITSRNGSRWGSGPYDVELVNGEPAPLRTPLGNRDHRRTMIVEVEPPTVYSGALPLLNPDDGQTLSVTASNTGNVVTLSADGGSGGVFYDLGDDTWDYSATGNLTHEYPAPGTYTVSAQRGAGKWEDQVEITGTTKDKDKDKG